MGPNSRMFTSTDIRNKKKFPCDKCELTYSGHKTLQNHKKTRHCDKCPEIFTSPKQLIDHVMRAHGLDIGPRIARIRGRNQPASYPGTCPASQTGKDQPASGFTSHLVYPSQSTDGCGSASQPACGYSQRASQMDTIGGGSAPPVVPRLEQPISQMDTTGGGDSPSCSAHTGPAS